MIQLFSLKIVIAGNKKDRRHIESSLKGVNDINEIIVPLVGVTHNVSSATNFFQIRLKDALVTSLLTAKVKNSK